MIEDEAGLMRIGALARLTGVTAESLRAWERRYRVLRPVRTAGGFRLYGAADVARVQRMKELIASGVPASEAARVAAVDAARGEAAPGALEPGYDAEALGTALRTFDEGGAHGALDRLLGRLTVETVMRDALLPELHRIGEEWERGELSIAQEHFASNLVRGRLMGLARGWDAGEGPRAVLACAAQERHDLSLIMFGIALRRLGWRITFLGADTPASTLLETVRALGPAVTVVFSTVRGYFDDDAAELAEVGRAWRLVIAGSGANSEIAQRLSARVLEEEPVSAAAIVAAAYPRGG